MESKRERFLRLANSRGQRLRREIRLIGNLSNTGNYFYTEEDVDELFLSLQSELNDARGLFESKLRKMGDKE